EARPSARELAVWLRAPEASDALLSDGTRQEERDRSFVRTRIVRALQGTSVETDVVLVRGPLGAGKTALVDRALEEFVAVHRDGEGEPPLVLRVECDRGLFQSYGVIRALGDALMAPLRGRLRAELYPLPGVSALSRLIEGIGLIDELFGEIEFASAPLED